MGARGDHGSRPALAGVVAAALAIGLTELAAGLVPSAPSLVTAVGQRLIVAMPAAVQERAISLLGTANKPVLLGVMLATAAVLGALVGVASARRPWVGPVAFGAFALAGAAAGRGQPSASSVLTAGCALAGAAAGSMVLLRLLRAGGQRGRADRQPADWSVPADRNRRRFLVLAGGAAAAAVLAAGTGRLLLRSTAGEQARAAVTIPPAVRRLPAPPAAATLDVEGLSPLFVPNDDFYRIDTALVPPVVDPDTWELRITGMVDRPVTLSYSDLLALPLREADITLACVSNEVGGGLVGNARWTGVALSDLLQRAGVHVGATQVVGRSVDGWTAGFPTTAALDDREALVAVAMNGEPLPVRHGFPARLVIPGLYGYVSATKWLTEILLTRLEDVDGYWVPRGWAKEAPIKTQSRIDVPAGDAVVPTGRVAVAGVAWAGTQGVAAVDVQVDDGPWHPAELAAELAATSWRQWLYRWDAQPGSHTLRVRATDGDGRVQSAQPSPTRPDGATGHHTVRVTVNG